jgi:hypothetical protein
MLSDVFKIYILRIYILGERELKLYDDKLSPSEE